ncbi:hypothetical protein ABW20_dc0101502 [Dactylellina cionopaga]|nr:hypothetical protein ABW20_dc0101502 [Dactylellina cionopaga]
MAGLDAIFNREPPTNLERFKAFPKRYVAETLYQLLPKSSTNSHVSPSSSKLKIVCLSDTHNHRILDVPDGDILVHAGDLTENGSPQEVQEAIDWLDTLPHKYKIVIAGNHDKCLDPDYKDKNTPVSTPQAINWKSLIYLNESSTVINIPGKGRTVKIYGNPWTPRHGASTFQFPRHQDFWRNKIPSDVDILITHGPPRHHLDNHAGCVFLLKEVWRVRPKLHIFGHIHSGHGQEVIYYSQVQKLYEILCDGNGGIIDILKMLIWFLFGYVYALVADKGESNTNRTVLVNAAMVKSLKNDTFYPDIITTILD